MKVDARNERISMRDQATRWLGHNCSRWFRDGANAITKPKRKRAVASADNDGTTGESNQPDSAVVRTLLKVKKLAVKTIRNRKGAAKGEKLEMTFAKAAEVLSLWIKKKEKSKRNNRQDVTDIEPPIYLNFDDIKR